MSNQNVNVNNNGNNEIIPGNHDNLPAEISEDGSDNASIRTVESNQNNNDIPLNFLSRMITDFSGDPKELNNFLQNANNAIGLASQSQRWPLELFIFSKVSSEVKTKINMNDITTYTELRQKLLAVYSPVESYDYLMEQLETTKQRQNESIKEYYVRLDKITSKCLLATDKEATSHTRDSEKRVIQRIALRRFTHHTVPEI